MAQYVLYAGGPPSAHGCMFTSLDGTPEAFDDADHASGDYSFCGPVDVMIARWRRVGQCARIGGGSDAFAADCCAMAFTLPQSYKQQVTRLTVIHVTERLRLVARPVDRVGGRGAVPRPGARAGACRPASKH